MDTIGERMQEVITPDDLECGEIVEAGSYECPCGCDPDSNIVFLDAEGMKKVTHLKCRECGAIKPFWDSEEARQKYLKEVAEETMIKPVDT